MHMDCKLDPPAGVQQAETIYYNTSTFATGHGFENDNDDWCSIVLNDVMDGTRRVLKITSWHYNAQQQNVFNVRNQTECHGMHESLIRNLHKIVLTCIGIACQPLFASWWDINWELERWDLSQICWCVGQLDSACSTCTQLIPVLHQ